MSPPLPEPDHLILLNNALALVALMALYFFGVWLRTYVVPADTSISVPRQLMAAIPVGFITMGLYAKSALPPLLQAHSDVSSDVAIAIGYAIVLGMMSRETLDKMLKGQGPPTGRP